MLLLKFKFSRTQEKAEVQLRLKKEPSHPNTCARIKDRFANKWEKWKSSAPRIRQMNYGKGKRMSWIRKM